MFQNNGRGFLAAIPPVTRNIILINVIIWVAEIVSAKFGTVIINVLGLHFFGNPKFNPAQLITYMFVHDQYSFMHIFFNMFSLWMFGRLIEQVWGSRRFFIFYMVCGIGAALVQEGVWALTWQHDFISVLAPQNGYTFDAMKAIVTEGIASGDPNIMSLVGRYTSSMVTVGASGAVFGILLAFAFIFPNLPLYLFFIPIPIKAKYMVAGYAVIEFFLGVSGYVSTVAHFAHLGGMLFGLALLLWWRKKGTLSGHF